MTTPPSRHPAGTPDGGRFAPQSRGRAGVSLDYDPRAGLRNPHVDRFAAGPLTSDEERRLSEAGAEVTDEVRAAAERYFGGDEEAVLGLWSSHAVIGIVKLDSRRRYALLDGTVEDPQVRARFALEAPLTTSEAGRLEPLGWDRQEAEETLRQYLETGRIPEQIPPLPAAAVRDVARDRVLQLSHYDPAAYSVYAEGNAARADIGQRWSDAPAPAQVPEQGPTRGRRSLLRGGRRRR